MKIDKLDFRHWVALARFGIAVVLAILIRPFRVKTGRSLVLLYGHKLNGNLSGLYRYLHDHPEAGFDAVFLGKDAGYVEALRQDGIDAASGVSMSGLRALTRCSSIVTSHGLHSMRPLIEASDIRFFDVWHGIPFKGFDADDFKVQRKYDEAWVASDSQKDLWVGKYGFDPARVRATGYARTDRLVLQREDEAALRESFGIPRGRKAILFAPTWAQDDRGRSIYPFGCGEREFLGALSGFAEAHDAIILLRSHLNTGDASAGEYPGVIALPGTRFPDTEAILLASDVLVCDWSSIAFDFLLLQRPTLFLDVPPPFRKGFSLGPEYRFGAIVGDLPGLLRQLETCVQEPEAYWRVHAGAHQQIRHEVYGDKADGHSAARCVARLQASLGVAGG
jgi:CDP-glycerol glycerophosphotransferase